MYKKRGIIVFGVFFICFTVLIWRIINLQYLNSNKLSVLAKSQYSYKEEIDKTNYKLLDCNNNDLLNYKDKYYAVIVPQLFVNNDKDTDYENFLTAMYILRNYSDDYDLTKSKFLNSSQKLYLEIDKISYNKLKDIKGIKGIYTFSRKEIDNMGVWSIENLIINERNSQDNSLKSPDSLEMKIYNKTKNNEKAVKVFNKSLDGIITEGKANNPKNNVNVKLTLDKNMQEDIKKILWQPKYSKYNQIGVVLMESNTGKIKSIVQKDDSKPNVNLGIGTKNGFFPGSIFKIIVEEAALDKGIISPNQAFKCNGMYEKGMHRKHGTLTLGEALTLSCNDIFVKVATQTGFDIFNQKAKEQGLFEKVLNFDKEQHGAMEVDKPNINDGSLAATAMGQKIRITPIEAISIVNTIANKGKYIKPYIVDAYVNKDGIELEKLSTVNRRIVSESTANIIKSQMMDVVKKGTGIQANISGIELGGKTGSTERVELSKDGNGKVVEYSDGWFMGFFKKDNKYYSMIVFVKNINKDTESGGTTAAPVFKEILKSIFNK